MPDICRSMANGKLTIPAVRMHKCTRCHEVRPWTAEFYHRKRSETSGMSSMCKSCENRCRAERYRRHPRTREDHRREYSRRAKKCRTELDAVLKLRLTAARASSKQRGLPPMTITLPYLRAMFHQQHGRCAQTGHRMGFSCAQTKGHDKRQFSVSIDRIVPVRGYVVGNVRLTCFDQNMANGAWGDDACILREMAHIARWAPKNPEKYRRYMAKVLNDIEEQQLEHYDPREGAHRVDPK